MTKAKRNSVIAVLLSLTMVFTLVLGVLPNDAHAVTQAEIDALQEQKEALTAQRQEKQDIVDELESQHATVLEQKLAMDARNKFTQQQIDLTNNQIELYNQMIEDKKLEVEAAKQRGDALYTEIVYTAKKIDWTALTLPEEYQYLPLP